MHKPFEDHPQGVRDEEVFDQPPGSVFLLCLPASYGRLRSEP